MIKIVNGSKNTIVYIKEKRYYIKIEHQIYIVHKLCICYLSSLKCPTISGLVAILLCIRYINIVDNFDYNYKVIRKTSLKNGCYIHFEDLILVANIHHKEVWMLLGQIFLCKELTPRYFQNNTQLYNVLVVLYFLQYTNDHRIRSQETVSKALLRL